MPDVAGDRVLLTGGTGFVGSHVAEALVEAGHDVLCTVRAESDTRWIDPLDVERVRLDLASESEGGHRRALQGVETVIHVAGLTRARDPRRYRRVNVEATERLAGAASAAGVGRFVFVSSLAARGPDAADGPVSPYGRSKREAEERLRPLATEMPVTVLRPPGIYGPRDADFLPLFRMAARGWLAAPGGGARLQPVFVRDVARAVLAAAFPEGGGGGFGPFPIAEPATYAWPEVATYLGRALGRRVRLVPLPAVLFEAAGTATEVLARVAGKTPALDRRRARDVARHRYTCDPTAAARALGWRAETSLEEGLERTAAWYRAQGWLR